MAQEIKEPVSPTEMLLSSPDIVLPAWSCLQIVSERPWKQRHHFFRRDLHSRLHICCRSTRTSRTQRLSLPACPSTNWSTTRQMEFRLANPATSSHQSTL